MDFSKIKKVSVYLGGRCNFSCSYCDRDSIEETAGYQRLGHKDIDGIVNYLMNYPTMLEMLCFHGGEPFMFVRVMDEILDRLVERGFKLPTVFVQTNGSLLLNQDDFLVKWKDVLFISISYDFCYQALNRETFDIDRTLERLTELGIGKQLQHVIPTNQPDVLTPRHVNSLLEVLDKHKVEAVDLILLRHIRGSKGRFRVILNEFNVDRIIRGLLGLISVLYAHGQHVYVDGAVGPSINKNYFTVPAFVILSPDGYIYSEYDFLEYKIPGSKVGSWKYPNFISIKTLPHGDDRMVYEECKSCPVFHLCGIKFHHKETGTPVEHPDKCQSFYAGVEIAHEYNRRLQTQPSMFHHIMGKR